jgi:hypothetical protein
MHLGVSAFAPLRRGFFCGPGSRTLHPVNEPTLLEFLRRHWLAIAAAASAVWATESAAEGKTVLESLAGPVLVCAWLGTIFLLDRWVTWSRQNG